jgi:hypothetical protein
MLEPATGPPTADPIVDQPVVRDAVPSATHFVYKYLLSEHERSGLGIFDSRPSSDIDGRGRDFGPEPGSGLGQISPDPAVTTSTCTGLRMEDLVPEPPPI